jgi:hypothetical protein
MTIVPFRAEHLTALRLQAHQAMLSSEIAKPEYGEALVASGPCYSAVEGDAVFASAGFYHQWDGRAIVWALLAADAGRHFVRIHRAVLRSFEMHPYRRLETAVADGFPEGDRWAEMLGFKREGLMQSYLPGGGNAWLYARVS